MFIAIVFCLISKAPLVSVEEVIILSVANSDVHSGVRLTIHNMTS